MVVSHYMLLKCNPKTCRKCGSKHHTSLCDAGRYYVIQQQQSEDLNHKGNRMRAIDITFKLVTLHSTVLATVNGVGLWILFDI